MKTAFVVMPFGKNPDQKQHWRDIYHHMLKKVLQDAGYEVLRADDIGHQGNITAGVLKLLWSSDLVVADLSTCNPNVFYELGIRHALRRHGTILVCAKDESIPFDVSNYHVSFYETSIGAAERFKVQLKTRVEAISESESSDSPVFDFLQDELATLDEKLAKSKYELAALYESIGIVLQRLVISFGGEISLFVADNLISMFGASGTMLDRIGRIRFDFARESRVLLPTVRIRDNSEFPDSVYAVVMDDKEVQRGQVCADHCYVIGDIKGSEEYVESTTRDPITGELAYFVPLDKAHRLQGIRTRVVFPEDIFEYELKLVFQRCLNEIENVLSQEKNSSEKDVIDA